MIITRLRPAATEQLGPPGILRLSAKAVHNNGWGWRVAIAGSGQDKKENIMTGEKFAEIVTKRAHKRVQEKTSQFRSAIRNAFRQLTGEEFLSKNPKPGGARHANMIILQHMLDERTFSFTKGWPQYLWDREEKAVTEELLSMMDEMQKALLANGPKKGDCTPNT